MAELRERLPETTAVRPRLAALTGSRDLADYQRQIARLDGDERAGCDQLARTPQPAAAGP